MSRYGSLIKTTGTPIDLKVDLPDECADLLWYLIDRSSP